MMSCCDEAERAASADRAGDIRAALPHFVEAYLLLIKSRGQIEGNPLHTPPVDVVSAGTTAVLAFCRDMAEGGEAPCPAEVARAVDKLRRFGVLERWLLPRLWQSLRLGDAADKLAALTGAVVACKVMHPIRRSAGAVSGDGADAGAAEEEDDEEEEELATRSSGAAYRTA
jgi:hypothetical protein